MKRRQDNTSRWRYSTALGLVGLSAVLLVLRAFDLQVLDNDFLQNQGNARYLRTVSIPAHRGMLTDRNGEPLAISSPVESVWVNPEGMARGQGQLNRLAKVLDLDAAELRRTIRQRADREFLYIKRHVNPGTANAVRELDIPGVALQREYRRFYPTGEVSAHVVGFTDVDDQGQEGMELALNDRLRGVPGRKRVIKDRLGHIVEHVNLVRQPRPGKDLALAIDRRIQFIAYRELKAAVSRNRAASGSVVVVDVTSGEILAMVNQPSYNPHNRAHLTGDRYRNRAVTDVFEPGSTIKPFTVAAAIKTGKFHPDTLIDTTPGYYQISGNTIRDFRNYGLIDVATIIQKSSNVGVSKIGLALPGELLWETLSDVGFGATTGTLFPGESPGRLPFYGEWNRIEQATLSFGYGLSVTPLQMAQAYSIIAADGVARPLSFTKVDEPPVGQRILDADIARQVRSMLEGVVAEAGTGTRAQVAGYRVAGKTGTVRKPIPGGYSTDKYTAIFAGMAPASRPRLVMITVIDQPRGDTYYGGTVAAPVFSRVMAGALRLLDIPPDAVDENQIQLAEAPGTP